MTLDDLKNYKVKFRPVLKSKLDDMTLLSCPPPTAGPVLALTLNILDGKNKNFFDLQTATIKSNERSLLSVKRKL